MFEKSYLRRAGQLWKVWTAVTLAVLGAVTAWLGQSRLASASSEGLALLTVGIGLTFSAVAWAVWSVRCPTCRAKLFWRAVSEQPTSTWLNWLLAQPECPFCRATGADTPGISPVEPR